MRLICYRISCTLFIWPSCTLRLFFTVSVTTSDTAADAAAVKALSDFVFQLIWEFPLFKLIMLNMTNVHCSDAASTAPFFRWCFIQVPGSIPSRPIHQNTRILFTQMNIIRFTNKLWQLLLPLVFCLLIFSSSAVRVGGVVPSFTPTTDQWPARPSWVDKCICIWKSQGLNLRFVLVVWCWVKYVQCVKCHFFLCYSNLNWFILDVQMRCNTSFGIKHLLGYATPSVTMWLPSFVRAWVYRASQNNLTS